MKADKSAIIEQKFVLLVQDGNNLGNLHQVMFSVDKYLMFEDLVMKIFSKQGNIEANKELFCKANVPAFKVGKKEGLKNE